MATWCRISFEHFGSGNYGSNPLYCAENLYINNALATEIIIPDGVTSIGSYAFYNCSNLTTIAIPESVTIIGSYAFYGCSDLTIVNYSAQKVFSNIFVTSDYNNILLIVLGNSVKNIDTNAFASCSNLKRILIPKSVTEIENGAFSGCSNLTTIEFAGSKEEWNEIYIGLNNENLTNANIIYNSSLTNTSLTDLDYLTYTKNDDNTITITDCNTKTKNINIPKEIDGLPVTSINSSAFAYRSRLTSVTIPDSVTAIEERAFYGCSSLTDIVIPDGVTSIESNTFYNCSSLKHITIPDSVSSIGSYAFYGCDKLTYIYIMQVQRKSGSLLILVIVTMR